MQPSIYTNNANKDEIIDNRWSKMGSFQTRWIRPCPPLLDTLFTRVSL